MKKRVQLLSIVTISLGLINCGGGGSSSNTTTKNTDSQINNQQETPNNNTSILKSRYIRVGETVVDNKTGLIWQDNYDKSSLEKSWLTDDNYYTCLNDSTSVKCLDMNGDTAFTYCQELILGGYTNWRMPTQDELSTIVNKDNYPTIDETFKNTQASFYWSSTPDTTIVNYALGVFFNVGNRGSYNKSDAGNIRCTIKK
jgi:hypothetical protein